MFEPPLTASSSPVEPVSEPPVPKSRLPATLVRLIPYEPLEEETLPKVALAVPLVRSSAWPDPEIDSSLRVRVPKPFP